MLSIVLIVAVAAILVWAATAGRNRYRASDE